MSEPISPQLAELSLLSKAELIARFRRVFRTTPTQRASRHLLALMLAHHLQEKTFGGLSTTTRRQLLRIVQASERDEPIAPSRQNRLKLGTRLIRTWKGQAHPVRVVERGFEYKGKRYASLSEIARLITGTRWSGPAFFGLRAAKTEAKAS